MVDRVMFVGRATAENLFPAEDWALISITEPFGAQGEASLQAGWFEVPRCEFHDIDVENGIHVMPSAEHAEAIVQFVE